LIPHGGTDWQPKELPPAFSIAIRQSSISASQGQRISARIHVVRVKVAVAEDTPLPLPVIVMDQPLTNVALRAVFKLMLPEFPVPGWVKVAVTPLGSALVESVMLPV
jgi:hypothetical protein